MLQDECVIIAKVGRAVGLKGYCMVEPTGTTFFHLEPPFEVFVGWKQSSARPMVIEEIRERPKGKMCRFEGIEDRTAVEQLTNKWIYLSSSQLPKLEAGDYYHFELEGLNVVSDSSAETVGKVLEVVNLPSMDALEVRLVDGCTVLVPYNEQAIRSVDTNASQVVVRWAFIEELL
ncbi:ribosome maturation factor RimM [Chitinispirillales bacterium ANBcel5]|uniref:ribosome maturation factor RimM n=1 Tax=Cellulosispirillum alkaliphilum TaxID=3039283 RepID=UPI002A5507D9|nr:ribosome maturation factor RimM [Chitinispirillales bacterium ANBcel5]